MTQLPPRQSRIPHSIYIREPNELERKVLAYITKHPGLTHEDLAQVEEFGGGDKVHMAIAFLTEKNFVIRKPTTLALYPMDGTR